MFQVPLDNFLGRAEDLGEEKGALAELAGACVLDRQPMDQALLVHEGHGTLAAAGVLQNVVLVPGLEAYPAVEERVGGGLAWSDGGGVVKVVEF